VDGGGNGDYQTIQAAINAAHAQVPTSTNRWLVLVGPGSYTESLTLYDYVDVSGLSPGPAAKVVAPTAQSVIATPATSWLSNLSLYGLTDPCVLLNVADITLRMDTVQILIGTAAIGGIKSVHVDSTLELYSCDITVGGHALRVVNGTVKAYNTKFGTLSGPGYYPVYIEGGWTDLSYCEIVNSIGEGGVNFVANPGRGRILHCIVRKAAGTYSVLAGVACAAATVAGTLHNGSIHANVGVAVGNDADASV